MKIDPTQSVKNQVKNYVKIREGLRHSLPFQHGRKNWRSCSCVNSLIIFGFCGASLERQLPKLRRKGYSCRRITHFGCCIKRKLRENIQVCVNVLPTSYRQVQDAQHLNFFYFSPGRDRLEFNIPFISLKIVLFDP